MRKLTPESDVCRHIPSETPPSKTFPLAGFNISSAASATTGGRQLCLLGVSFVNSGAYSCEVIADGSFHTLIDTKNMTVIGESENQRSVL